MNSETLLLLVVILFPVVLLYLVVNYLVVNYTGMDGPTFYDDYSLPGLERKYIICTVTIIAILGMWYVNGHHFVPQGRCGAYKVTTIVITIGVIGWIYLSHSSGTTTGELLFLGSHSHLLPSSSSLHLLTLGAHAQRGLQ